MHKLYHLRLAIALFLFMTAAATSGAEPKPIQVLFIGNSYTYANDMPRMITELAKAGSQRPFHYELEAPGGCTLEKQWHDKKAVGKINATHWDFVVLQEQSTRPLTHPELMFDYAKKLDGEIKRRKATTLLFQTWARQNQPEKQAELNKVYLALGTELKANVAPVGMAWERTIKEHPALPLHHNDKSHPNQAGSYLTACVFYAAIYAKSPEGLPGKIGGLEKDDARKLQLIAWETVQKLADHK